MTTISLIVPAAGCGARTKLDGNKILVPLHGRPLLWWTLRALSSPQAMPDNCRLIEILVAARREEFALIESVFELLQTPLEPQSTLAAEISLRLIEGGAHRQASVQNAVRVATGNLVAVHDAARPLVSPALVARVIAAAQESGAAIAALPVADTVKIAHENALPTSVSTIEQTFDRNRIWLAQTPQVFARKVLWEALQHAERDNFIGTDCASLVEHHAEVAVSLIEGETTNFKVTFATDIERALNLLDSNEGV